MKVSKDAVLKLFRNTDTIHEFREIMGLFGIGKGERLRLKAVVDDLVDDGKLQRHKGNRYSKAPETAPVLGKLTSHRDGYGFVAPEGGGEDIFIPARYLRESMHGDRVEVRVAPGRSGKAEGRIIRTLERGYDRIVGTFHKSKNFGYVIPDEQRITRDIYIPPGATGKAEMGQIVVAELTSYPSEDRSAQGRVVEILGWPEDSGVEAETIIRKYDLPRIFPTAVVAEARRVPQEIDREEVARRVDLRDRLIVTIDGETARDFDDAVGVQREAGGNIRLWVSIADVSHYVHPAAPLDAEAFLRGTSIYFPDRCIPMLPEELSNGICSLNPHVDRLTVTAEMVFDQAGQRREMTFYPSVIRSTARLTYTIVKQILEESLMEISSDLAHLIPDLQLMKELALRLNENRKQRGSIDFDLPEPEIVLDIQGQTEAIIKAERNIAHRIIEEFMLAANEAVASHLEDREVPSLYRIHEVPDPVKVSDMIELIRSFGHDFKLEEERLDPLQFQKLLAQVLGRPEEKLINGMLLRAMKQARYSDDNLGHFGLATSCYTHFTSPIRRYPDLVVHRILKDLLAGRISGNKKERIAAELPEIASHTSQRERLAMEAEREMVLLKKIQFMRDKVGQEFDGFITGVSPYGFYVELVDLFVEGMVHISTLPQDFYRYLEKNHLLLGDHSKRTFRMGDKVRVLLAQVSTEKRQMDFVLSEEGADSFMVNASIVSPEEDYPKIPVGGKRPAVSKGKRLRKKT